MLIWQGSNNRMFINRLYAGVAQTLAPSGQRTGIYKKPIQKARVGLLGIDGDVQVDKRYHGGPDKALHQFTVVSYSCITAHYPSLVDKALPGSIGENLTIEGMSEQTVCIGDIYRLGKVRVQVSEPRQPCWKINARYGVEKLSEFIEQRRIAGWYYRVLETGEITVGDEVVLVDRFNENITIDYFNDVKNQHRPALNVLDQLIAARGLAAGLKQRLVERRAYLQDI